MILMLSAYARPSKRTSHAMVLSKKMRRTKKLFNWVVISVQMWKSFWLIKKFVIQIQLCFMGSKLVHWNSSQENVNACLYVVGKVKKAWSILMVLLWVHCLWCLDDKKKRNMFTLGWHLSYPRQGCFRPRYLTNSCSKRSYFHPSVKGRMKEGQCPWSFPQIQCRVA